MATEENEEAKKKQKRILILCVDRDGDLGTKAEIKTPLVGRKENLQAAVELALRDPEEPDANAMFEAIRLYDRLQNEGKQDETFEVATISGSELGGVGADRKLVAELKELLNSFSANEVILVTDGYYDEAVIPLVESRVPVSHVRRVVVKHSESIEETAAILTKYLKMIVEDPRYSRIALGLPGLLLIILGVLSIFNLINYYLLALPLVLGAFMLYKGFGTDKALKAFYQWVKEYSPPPLQIQISNFSLAISALCIIVGVYLGLVKIPAQPDLAALIGNFASIIGYFIQGSIDLIIVGVCVALLGRAIRWYMERDARLLRNVALIVSIGWSRQILYATSELLINPADPAKGIESLVIYIAVGILIGVAAILLIFVIHRSAREFFKETEAEVEELKES